jgi:hypothetical protein
MPPRATYPACDVALSTLERKRDPAGPLLRGGESFGSNGSSFREAINLLQRVQSHSSVNHSPSREMYQRLAKFRGKVSIFGV